MDVLKAILSDPEIDVVRLKNRFKNPTAAGFRDLNFNIRIKCLVPGLERIHHICELQVYIPIESFVFRFFFYLLFLSIALHFLLFF